MNRLRWTICAATAMGLAALGTPARAYSQTDQRSVTAHFHGVDIRTVLQGLFNTTGTSYIVLSDVRGQVTVDMDHAPLETLVRAAVQQVGAKLTIENGIYEISMAVPKKSKLVVEVSGDTVTHLEAAQDDVREVVRELFAAKHVNFDLDPNVRGTVTLHLVNIPWETALQNVLREVDAAYREIGNTFYVVDRSNGASLADATTNPIQAIQFVQSDVREVLRHLFRAMKASYTVDVEIQGTVSLTAYNVKAEDALRNVLNMVDATYTIENGVYHVSRKNSTPKIETADPIVPSIEAMQVDVRSLLRQLFKSVDASYSIAPEVQGTVSVSLKNVTLSNALTTILRQVGATYKIEGGVYLINKQ